MYWKISSTITAPPVAVPKNRADSVIIGPYRVLERRPVNDLIFAETLHVSQLDVVLVEGINHAGAHDSRGHPECGHGKRERGKHQVLYRAPEKCQIARQQRIDQRKSGYNVRRQKSKDLPAPMKVAVQGCTPRPVAI